MGVSAVTLYVEAKLPMLMAMATVPVEASGRTMTLPLSTLA